MLVLPAVVCGLADLQVLGHRSQVLTLYQQPVRLPELAHGLLRRVFPALHVSSSWPSRALENLSHTVDYLQGITRPLSLWTSWVDSLTTKIGPYF